MEPERIVKYVLGELRVIGGAPVSFFAALLVLAGAVWWAMDWRYSGIIANRDAELGSAKAVRDEYKEKLQGATPDQAKTRIDTLEARIKRLEPRTLTPDQRNQIAKFVSVPTGSTYVLSVMSNMDCKDCNEYATDFQSVLHDAQWFLQPAKIMANPGASPKGVAIVTPDLSAPLPEAIALRQALLAANIPFDVNQGSDVRGNKRIAGLIISPRASPYSDK
jgi:hypothetical protein